jgi:tRNA (guanine-N7-)-methyltransferase
MHAPRRIRSFVLRAGRVTAAQERALAELWPRFGIEMGAVPLDLDAVFERAPRSQGARGRSPRCLEIGFGTGELLGKLATDNPDIDYLGIEVHRSGVGRLLLQIEQSELTNVRVVCHDAVEVLKNLIPNDSFDEMLVFFPDPWHKKRHHKRRLIDADFVDLLADKMADGGILRLATDWQDYAEQMLAVCNANARWLSLSADRTFVMRPDFRQPTRFERRGARLGHGVWDLAYRKRPA